LQASRIGDPAKLFPDRHLVDDPQIETAMAPGHVHRTETQLHGHFLVPLADIGGQAAFIHLGFDFAGNQFIFSELPGLLLPFPGGRVQVQFHGFGLLQEKCRGKVIAR
jgi:hypothetical protein